MAGSVTILTLNMKTHEYLINSWIYRDFPEKYRFIISRIFYMSIILKMYFEQNNKMFNFEKNVK